MKDYDKQLVQDIKAQTTLAEKLENDLQFLYFERAIKCATQQTLVVTKYFKVLMQANCLIEIFSENLSQSVPTTFQRFLDTFEKQMGGILQIVSPSLDKGVVDGQKSVKVRLEKVVETIGEIMHK